MTRGQFGSDADLATDELKYTTLNFGCSVSPSEIFTIDFDATWVDARESIDPVSFSMTPAQAAVLIHSSYDMSEFDTYSALDSERWDIRLGGQVRLFEGVNAVARYTYLDFADNTGYLTDLSGTLHQLNVGVRWIF